MNVSNSLLFLICIFISVLRCCDGIDCLDEDGYAVDWWVISKIPPLKESGNELFSEGTGYLYYDSNKDGSFLPSDKSIDSHTSAVGYTLSQIYDSSENVGYAFYNDMPPSNRVYESDAHSKGVVGYDSASGFWLVHSVPKFPPNYENAYSYPDTGREYSQSMLCMSLPLSEINTAGRQFQTTGPNFYDFSMPDSLKDTLPDLYDATVNKKKIRNPTSRIATLISKGGMEFTFFAKSKEFGEDLYAGLVSPSLEKSLLAETWIRGDRVTACCEVTHCQYDVYNVNEVKFNELVTYKETQDHSKWAVALDKSTLCIGDINRMSSQYHRGGGTVCFVEQQLATFYVEAATYDLSDCLNREDDFIETSYRVYFRPKVYF